MSSSQCDPRCEDCGCMDCRCLAPAEAVRHPLPGVSRAHHEGSFGQRLADAKRAGKSGPLSQDAILDMADGCTLQFHDLLEFARKVERAHGIHPVARSHPLPVRLNMTASRVYKYPLPPLGDWISLTMPEGAEPLCVQVQHGQPCMWARVEVGRPPVVHHFRVAGTGHDLGSNIGRHIDSFQLHGGGLVFHVFADGAA